MASEVASLGSAGDLPKSPINDINDFVPSYETNDFVPYETRQTSFVALETVSNNIGMSGRSSVSVSVRATQNNNG